MHDATATDGDIAHRRREAAEPAAAISRGSSTPDIIQGETETGRANEAKKVEGTGSASSLLVRNLHKTSPSALLPYSRTTRARTLRTRLGSYA